MSETRHDGWRDKLAQSRPSPSLMDVMHSDPACDSTAVLPWWNHLWDDVTVQLCWFHEVSSMDSMVSIIELELEMNLMMWMQLCPWAHRVSSPVASVVDVDLVVVSFSVAFELGCSLDYCMHAATLCGRHEHGHCTWTPGCMMPRSALNSCFCLFSARRSRVQLVWAGQPASPSLK